MCVTPTTTTLCGVLLENNSNKDNNNYNSDQINSNNDSALTKLEKIYSKNNEFL